MSENEQRLAFAKNLNRLLESADKTQIEVAQAIGVSQQTFNTWARGIAIPRMGKIQLLADYFGVKKSQLLGEEEETTWYLNPETALIAQQIFESKELSALFNAARDASPETLLTTYDLLLTLKRRENHEE